MTNTKTTFKSLVAEKRWIELQKEKTEIQTKKITTALQERVEIINSLMTSCKVGFSLSEAKVKKISKFIKEITNYSKVKYGTLPIDLNPSSTLFKDVIVLYVEKDGQIIFKENE